MFAAVEHRDARWGVRLSVVAHLCLFAALGYRQEPPLLHPETSLRGNGGASVTQLVYVAQGVSSVAMQDAKEQPEQELKSKLELRKKKVKAEPKPAQLAAVAVNQETRPGMPGFVLGSALYGVAGDHDVRIALPVVAPDPPIVRRVPDWVRGDVVVEITIDDQGVVTNAKVLEHVGFGVAEEIVSTVRSWKFTPAKIDGMPVASRQDVRYHFPS